MPRLLFKGKPLPKGYCRQNNVISYQIYTTKIDNIYSLRTLKRHKTLHKNSKVFVTHPEYVYDLETEKHLFIDSLGCILLHNTDSSFVQFKFEGKSKEEILELMFKLEKRINEVYLPEFCKKYGVEPILSIKLEKFYDRFGITVDAKKKRYFGHIVWRTNWVDDYDIKGFEYRRGDASQLTKRVQKTLISMLCQGKSWNEIAMYLLTEEKKILNGEYPIDEIGIPRGLSKDLDEYVNEDVHIKGIKYAREHLNLEIPEGIKAKRVYIKRVPKGYPSTESICFLHGEDVPQGFIVDWKMMAEKVLKDKVTDFIAFHGKKWVNVVENDLTQYCDS